MKVMFTISRAQLCRIIISTLGPDCDGRLCIDCVNMVVGKYDRFFVATGDARVVSLVPAIAENLLSKHICYLLCLADLEDIETRGTVLNDHYQTYVGEIARFTIVDTEKEESLSEFLENMKRQ